MTDISSFSIEKPQCLIFVLLLIPALTILFYQFGKIKRIMKKSDEKNKQKVKELKFSFYSRILFQSFGWIFALLALSGISYGSKKVPVLKSGKNIDLIFDISYSMLAKDAGKNLSRLDAVKIYINSLIENMSGCSFSAILAKGDGFVAISETEDREAILNLVENLSPHMMTASGSSLAKGLEAAINGIPANSTKSHRVWIFTDGDETDNLLEKSLLKSAKAGIPVTIIGFGQESESEITAGDGKTKVKTALRSNRLKKIAEKTGSLTPVTFIEAKAKGSAWNLLKQVQGSKESDAGSRSYEIVSIKRHSLFLLLSIFSIFCSFLFSEGFFYHAMTLIFKKTKAKKTKSATIITLILLLSSCTTERKQMLDGVLSWNEGNYPTATANFLKITRKNKTESVNYGIFNLGTTYLSMGEKDAAMEKLSKINLSDKNLPPDLKSAVCYNKGIIYLNNNDYKNAAANFRMSILSAPSGRHALNAKINLELCERKLVQEQTKAGQSEMTGINEEKSKNRDMEIQVFNLIRQNEGKKWKNMTDGQSNENDVLDY
ncbi:MAG: VWA domain-containing protein [Treponema sp.]|nr:VWA domain-containing protein [Treponema sp.]